MQKNPDDRKKRAGEITQPTECQCCVGPVQGMKQTEVRMSKHSRHAPAMKKMQLNSIGRRQYQLQIGARSVRLSPAGTPARIRYSGVRHRCCLLLDNLLIRAVEQGSGIEITGVHHAGHALQRRKDQRLFPVLETIEGVDK